MSDTDGTFVPPGFAVPTRLVSGELELTPLGPQHHEGDYLAWTSSMDHIRGTPGFPWGNWPYQMPPEKNIADLRRHAEDFQQRKGFTYTVQVRGEIVGCVYIYPAKDRPGHAAVRSWVRHDHADLDSVLYHAVLEWLRDWPFTGIDYAPRPPRWRTRAEDSSARNAYRS